MEDKNIRDPLPISFYLNNYVVLCAQNLLGKILYTNIENSLTSGIITETEAYAGIKDKASHAFGGRRTPRTEIMYAQGGCSYVYLCYGIHKLFNVITNVKDIPDAVLIRGIYPAEGLQTMLARAQKSNFKYVDGIGPGKVSTLLGISLKDNGISLLKKGTIWITDSDLKIRKQMVFKAKRVGIGYAGEDADLLYRFYLDPQFVIKTIHQKE
ncbi:MAG: DNA-3-methyladenine glycosylase [Bacteroidales bacterium]|nr:DNA-3-methyladenine glycosylase [Bacteroidales bacterium]